MSHEPAAPRPRARRSTVAVVALGTLVLSGVVLVLRPEDHGPLPQLARPHLVLPEAATSGPSSAAVVSRRVGHAWGGWRVAREISIHRVVVMTIEAADLGHAQDIAVLVVEPYQATHLEALIYFVEPGRGETPAFRIRWTPRTGFAEEHF